MKNSKEKSSNSWVCEEEKEIITSPVMNLIQQKCRSSEDERRHTFYFLRSSDWCHVIPVTEDGKVVFVKQYRIGIHEHTLEVPGGVADPEDESLEATALREMTEETGYVGLPDSRCEYLGWTHPNPAIMDNRCHSFIVGPVRKEKDQKLDHGEMIETVEIPITEIPERIERGEISHALMLNAFFFLLATMPESKELVRKALSSYRKN